MTYYYKNIYTVFEMYVCRTYINIKNNEIIILVGHYVTKAIG